MSYQSEDGAVHMTSININTTINFTDVGDANVSVTVAVAGWA